MPQAIYVFDAFITEAPFSGNPAGVCLLTGEVSAQWMQLVAAEMNQAETAFLWPLDDGSFGLRWFTPTVEVELCGHATLASAEALRLSGLPPPYRFQTLSGELVASVEDTVISLDFPVDRVGQTVNPALNAMFPQAIFTGAGKFDWFVELPTEAEVRAFQPNFEDIRQLGKRGLIVSAVGETYDVVSRFFAPQSGIPEDPVTGSAHCALADYYGAKLQRTELRAFQASLRTGFVHVKLDAQRVKLEGMARLIVAGTLYA